MANSADILVKNSSFRNVKIFREVERGIFDLEITLEKESRVKVGIPNPEAALIIREPKNEKIENFFINVISDSNIKILYCRANSAWTFRIPPNLFLSDIAANVKIELRDNEPE